MSLRLAANLNIGIVAFAVSILIGTGTAQGIESDESPGPRMTVERLGELIVQVDEHVVRQNSAWFFHLESLEVAVVFDTAADRMRIMIPIDSVDELDEEMLRRLMQANFDSALDARYAIANGTMWGVFIHPLGALTSEEFLVGLGQTVNVVMSYGSSYSSGLLMYGDGDSSEIERRELIDRLRESET